MTIISNFDGVYPLDSINNSKWSISYTVKEDDELRSAVDHAFEREITPIVKSYGRLILDMMKMMSDSQLCQILADQPDMIRFIIDPSDKMQYISLIKDVNNYTYIGNISEYNALLVLKKTEGREFSELSQNIQTENMIKIMHTKYAEFLNYKDITYDMRELKSLKSIMDELKLRCLEEM